MDRMRELIDLLNKYSRAYYTSDSPLVSDYEFDLLMDELIQLERDSGIVLPDSPTHRVGDAPASSFKQHKHINRLWSLDKVKTTDELREWAARCEKTSGDNKQEYVLEYKFDGLTINLTYEDGVLKQAATRGNGIVGEQILSQARTIRNIPLSIPYKGLLEVRGECYMKLSVLKELNESGAESLKNARNAAAGAVRNLDPRVSAQRKLDCYCYNIGFIDNREFDTQVEMLDFLRDNGFPVCDFCFVGGIDRIISKIESVCEQRQDLDFLIDGMVVKMNDIRLKESLGYTDRFPRGEIAYKFPAQELVTVITDITWEVGRTGKLTPLAHLQPVDFYGVTVKRATLNNFDDIQRKQVGIGSRVLIRRSNDVIPEILKSVDDMPPANPVSIPLRCPACNSHIERRGVHAFCTNSLSCPPQIIGRLVHYASRDAMDIEGFSEKTARLLSDKLGLTKIPQLYELNEQSFDGLAGFKGKRIINLLNAIEDSKKCELSAFIYALGIPNVGIKTAKDLAYAFGSLEGVRSADASALAAIPDVGSVVSQSIVDFFADPMISAQIDSLLALGVAPEAVERKNTNKNIEGKTFVVTGTLERMSRSEIEALIDSLGGKASGSVSKKTDYVVAGKNAGSKLAKAGELGVKVIDEDEFFDMIG